MKKTAVVNFMIQAVFFAGFFVAMFYQGGFEAIESIARDETQLFFTLSSGLSLSLALSLLLKVSVSPSKRMRLLVLLSQTFLLVGTAYQGYIFAVITPFPLYISYKYWSDGNS